MNIRNIFEKIKNKKKINKGNKYKEIEYIYIMMN